METVISFFIVLQTILFFFMTFHDWVHIPPLTDIRELEKHSTFRGRFINSIIFAFFVALPLWLTWLYRPDYPWWVVTIFVTFYGLLTMGTIFSWWIPYFYGSSEQQKKDFAVYENTHHFLSARGDNIIPNTFHVILHLQIWTCLALSLYLVFFN